MVILPLQVLAGIVLTFFILALIILKSKKRNKTSFAEDILIYVIIGYVLRKTITSTRHDNARHIAWVDVYRFLVRISLKTKILSVREVYERLFKTVNAEIILSQTTERVDELENARYLIDLWYTNMGNEFDDKQLHLDYLIYVSRLPRIIRSELY